MRITFGPQPKLGRWGGLGPLKPNLSCLCDPGILGHENSEAPHQPAILVDHKHESTESIRPIFGNPRQNQSSIAEKSCARVWTAYITRRHPFSGPNPLAAHGPPPSPLKPGDANGIAFRRLRIIESPLHAKYWSLFGPHLQPSRDMPSCPGRPLSYGDRAFQSCQIRHARSLS